MTATEKQVIEQLRQAGYKVLRGGWPDFLAIKNGEMRFIEVKSPSAPRLSKRQKRMKSALRKRGIEVEVLIPRKKRTEQESIERLTQIQNAWRSGGLKGGPARAAKLSKERRSEIARLGGLASATKKLAKTI